VQKFWYTDVWGKGDHLRNLDVTF